MVQKKKTAMIRYSIANAKIQALRTVKALRSYLADGRKVFSFDLLSGHSCPFARQCLSKVTIVNGRRTIVDGAETIFRCFSATQEAAFTATYNRRAENFDSLRRLSRTEIVDTLSEALPSTAGIVRLHVAGDFYNRSYFRAWSEIARLHPGILFYAYTKSLPYWVARIDSIPANLSLTASRGGRMDHLINEYGLKEAVVVFSEEEAAKLGLEIDHDDSHAVENNGQSFALLLHGTQQAKSLASAAIKAMKVKGTKFSYPKAN